MKDKFNNNEKKARINIQLNYESLKEIIGKDVEVDVEIRNHIVQEFTRKHLKAVLNEDKLMKIICDIRKQMFSRDNYFSIELDEKYKKKIEKLCDNYLVTITNKFIREVEKKINKNIEIEFNKLVDGIERKLEYRLNDIISDVLKRKFDKKAAIELLSGIISKG